MQVRSETGHVLARGKARLDWAENTIAGLDPKQFPMLAGICPYEDTVFNSIQRQMLVAELGRLRSHRLLEGFRGSPAVDLKAVAGAVAAAGRLMTDYPRITELDINPLVARPDGVTALDALIVCSESPDPDKREKRPAHAQRG